MITMRTDKRVKKAKTPITQRADIDKTLRHDKTPWTFYIAKVKQTTSEQRVAIDRSRKTPLRFFKQVHNLSRSVNIAVTLVFRQTQKKDANKQKKIDAIFVIEQILLAEITESHKFLFLCKIEFNCLMLKREREKKL